MFKITYYLRKSINSFLFITVLRHDNTIKFDAHLYAIVNFTKR